MTVGAIINSKQIAQLKCSELSRDILNSLMFLE